MYFFYLDFLSRIGEGTYLSSHYYFHPHHRHLEISRAITAGNSPLHIASGLNQTGNLRFPSTSC